MTVEKKSSGSSVDDELFVFKSNSPGYCSNNIIQQTADGSVNIPVIITQTQTLKQKCQSCAKLIGS